MSTPFKNKPTNHPLRKRSRLQRSSITMTFGTSVYFAGFTPSSSEQDEEVEEVCIANISPLERQKRLRFGIQQFITTLVILAILIVLGVNHFWRLPLLLMFWAAAVGFFQAYD